MVGRLCQQVAQAIGARDVFEMGSGFGYSTWWFAQAVGPGGRVVHTDGDVKRSAEACPLLTWRSCVALHPATAPTRYADG